MADGRVSFIDTATMSDLEFKFRPDPNSIARRSISIFSRRGPDAPDAETLKMAQAATPTPAPVSRQMTQKQKSWLSRRRSQCVDGSQKRLKSTEGSKKPKGTVLNAVPKANVIQMTALEEEMATSPNDEILSAVTGPSPADAAWAAHSRQTTPTQTNKHWNRSVGSLALRNRFEKQKETNNRIGLWVNGVAQWDEGALRVCAKMDHHTVQEETGFTPLRQATFDRGLTPPLRPTLSVTIPGDERTSNDRSVYSIARNEARNPVVSVVPASKITKFDRAPTITIIEPQVVAASITHSLPSTAAAHLEPSTRHWRPSGSRTSSTSSSDAERDDSSIYSQRSSVTSIEVPPAFKERSAKRLSGNVPTAFPASEPILGEPQVLQDLEEPLPVTPKSLRRSSVPGPTSPIPEDSTRELYHSSSSVRSVLGGRSLRPHRPHSCSNTRSRSLTHAYRGEQEVARGSRSQAAFGSATPPLSEAEHELNSQLSRLSMAKRDDEQLHVCDGRSDQLRRQGSVRSVMQPPERAPTLPKRSRKREWRMHTLDQSSTPCRRRSETEMKISAQRPQQVAAPANAANAANVRRSVSAAQFTLKPHGAAQAQRTPPTQRFHAPKHLTALSSIFVDDGLVVVQGPMIIGEDGERMPSTAVAAASAEEVLLHIMSTLTTTIDLFNTSRINKGMYRVFKENEMHLMRAVAFNQSPAAWELREWSPPERNAIESSKASSQLGHTPESYARCQKRDSEVVESLKVLILQRCQNFIRRETVSALSTPTDPNAQRYNDAFWRIWCFCKIFGCEKGREDDITGQLDWLKGGLLANNQSFSATVNTNLDFEMGSVLLNAPDHFAKGNANGLNAEQLYDMSEIWTCMNSLLQGYQGCIEEARKAGVFAGCDVTQGNEEKEDQVLEEWIFHLMTLGPATVLELAQHVNDSSSAGFDFAKASSLTSWSQPQWSGSRGTFLKEPVSRLYEERIAAAATEQQDPLADEQKDMSRKRVASLAAEIRLHRQTSTYKRSPYIDMNNEKPMSVTSRRTSVSSTRSHRSVASMNDPSRRMSPSPMTPNFSSPRPTTPSQWSPRKISPIIEDRVESFNKLSLQNFAPGVAEDTAGLAIGKIVEMGFSPAQAAEALRLTDMGDGLRCDRAVDLLLRRRL